MNLIALLGSMNLVVSSQQPKKGSLPILVQKFNEHCIVESLTFSKTRWPSEGLHNGRPPSSSSGSKTSLHPRFRFPLILKERSSYLETLLKTLAKITWSEVAWLKPPFTQPLTSFFWPAELSLLTHVPRIIRYNGVFPGKNCRNEQNNASFKSGIGLAYEAAITQLHKHDVVHILYYKKVAVQKKSTFLPVSKFGWWRKKDIEVKVSSDWLNFIGFRASIRFVCQIGPYSPTYSILF